MSEIIDEATELAAAREGDTEAFAVLYRRHRSSALAFATTLVGSGDAPDIVAESFTKILKALRTGSGPQDELRPYLFTTVRSVAIDRSRKPPTAGYEPTDDDLAAPARPHRAVADSLADQDLLRRIMSRLPERWRRALWLSEVEGKPARALATELGVSANSAAAVLYRAREGLRTAYLAEWLAQQPEAEHAEILEELPAFVRDSLSRRSRQRVEEHLAGCATCTALTAELQSVNVTLSAQSSLVYLAVAAVPALAAVGTAGGVAGVAAIGGSSATAGGTATVGVKLVAGLAAVAIGATALFLVLREPAAAEVERAVPLPVPVSTSSTVATTSATALESTPSPTPSSAPSSGATPSSVTPTSTTVPPPSTTPPPPAPTSEPEPELPPPPAEPTPEPAAPAEPEPAPVDTCAVTIEGADGVQCLGVGPAAVEPDPTVGTAPADPQPSASIPLFSVGPEG